MRLSGFTLTPTSITGGNPVLGKATLECKAGARAGGGATGQHEPAAANPVATSIVVPQGLQSATFEVATGAVLAKSYATIAGIVTDVTKSKVLTVTPAASVSPTALKFGSVTVARRVDRCPRR